MSGHFLISATIIHVISLETSKFEWTRNNRIDKIILVPIWAIYIYIHIYIYIYMCIYIYMAQIGTKMILSILLLRVHSNLLVSKEIT